MNVLLTMDIMGSLPPELSQKILLLLSVRDLFNCMEVCKTWRRLINCHYIWNHYNKSHGLDISEEESVQSDIASDCELLPLCSQAVALKNYLLSTAYQWEKCEFSFSTMNLKYRFWRVIGFGSYLVILYHSVNQLHIFEVSRNSVSCCDVIVLDLPSDSLDQKMLMNSKYLVIGAYNLTLVYLLQDGHFNLFRMFALKHDPILYDTMDNFDSFRLEFIVPNHCVYQRILLEDILWITDPGGNKHIIDLMTGRKHVFSTILLYTKDFSGSDYVLNYANVDILVTDKYGESVSSFSVQNVDKTFYINSNILCICFPRFIENDMIFIECRKITSGDLIRRLSVPERTRMTLHSTEDILFTLSTLPGLYSVSSTCVQTGATLWKYEVSLGPHMFWGSFLHMISKHFIVVYPGPSSDDFFALFNIKGEMLYESCLTSGIIVYFSDSLVVSKEEGRLHLMIC